MSTDALGRPEVSDTIRQQIKSAFAIVPEHKRGAVLVMADGSGTATAHFAARIGGDFKVAAGAGWKLGEKRPAWYVGVDWAF